MPACRLLRPPATAFVPPSRLLHPTSPPRGPLAFRRVPQDVSLPVGKAPLEGAALRAPGAPCAPPPDGAPRARGSTGARAPFPSPARPSLRPSVSPSVLAGQANPRLPEELYSGEGRREVEPVRSYLSRLGAIVHSKLGSLGRSLFSGNGTPSLLQSAATKKIQQALACFLLVSTFLLVSFPSKKQGL